MRSLSRFSQTPWPGGASERRLLLIVPQQSGFQSSGSRLSENLTEPAEKILPVRVIPVNPAALNPTADNMLQRSGGINAGSVRHAGILLKPIHPKRERYSERKTSRLGYRTAGNRYTW